MGNLCGGDMSDKTSWPELVGKDGEEAKAAILKERKNLTVHSVPEGNPVTMDYRTDRVRIYVNPENKVIIVPPDSGVSCDYRLDRVWIYVNSQNKVTRTPKCG